jgi:hypothetical protein
MGDMNAQIGPENKGLEHVQWKTRNGQQQRKW